MARQGHLDRLATLPEVDIETRSGDNRYRTIIWVVESNGSLYVRSFLGDEGKWYQRALEDPRVALIADDLRVEFAPRSATDPATVSAVSASFRRKYPRGGSLDAMVLPEILHTTLLLEPID